MKFPNAPLFWAGFAATSLLACAAYLTLWNLGAYWIALQFLAVVNGCLAIAILTRTKEFRGRLAVVLLGLMVGQFWLIENAVMHLLWRMRGFAP